jgi:two-component system, cell cycle response regulator
MKTRPRHILVVDVQDDHRRHRLVRQLRACGFITHAVGDPDAARAAVETQWPDLLLVAVETPKWAALSLVREVRALRAGAELPLVLISTPGQSEHVVQVLGAGADDYVSRPVHAEPLVVRISTLLNNGREVAALTRESALLRAQSFRDPLTNLPNRRALGEALPREVARARRGGTPLSALLLDIDRFKRLNEAYGHTAADWALVTFAGRVDRSLRAGVDRLFRYGGEEFVVLLGGDARMATLVGERIRGQVAREPFVVELEPVLVTVSVGGATAGPDETPESLLERAEAALEQAKARRNAVVVADGD